MADIPSKQEKCTGAMLASAIGDALGWPYEFRANNSSRQNLTSGDYFADWTRRAGGRYWGHTETIRAGEYSDDTQMILSVSRSIVSGNWESFFVSKELPYWLGYERGGGRALKSAANVYKKKKKPWERENAIKYFDAGGNGAVTRILPHVIAQSNSTDIGEIMKDVTVDSVFTHGHPRAILGATCYAYALQAIMAKNTVLEFGELINIVIEGVSNWGTFREDAVPSDWIDAVRRMAKYDFHGVWLHRVNDMLDKLSFISNSLKEGLLVDDKNVLTELKCFDKENGAGDVAILAALYLASKYANNPVLGIKTAAYSLGTDTDTIASITGGLLGMLCGTAWIPAEWRLVQDYTCICDMADILLSNDMKEASKRVIETSLAHSNQQYIVSPIGKLYIVDIKEIFSGKTSRITTTKMQSLLGQTFYIKKFERFSQKELPMQQNFEINTAKTNRHLAPNNRAISLDINTLRNIKDDPAFARITFRKVLQIADMIWSGDRTIREISQALKVDENIVQQIAKLIFQVQ